MHTVCVCVWGGGRHAVIAQENTLACYLVELLAQGQRAHVYSK